MDHYDRNHAVEVTLNAFDPLESPRSKNKSELHVTEKNSLGNIHCSFVRQILTFYACLTNAGRTEYSSTWKISVR